MEELTKNEMREIYGGIDEEAYNAGHAAGDFVQEVLRGVIFLYFFRKM